MNEQKLETRIEQRVEERWGRHRRQDGRRWVGLLLLVVGGLFLARESGVEFPNWFFTWPMLLIGFGLFSGIRHGFRGFGWLLPILIGGFFLVDKLSPELRLRPYIWPAILMTVGLVFLLRPKRTSWYNPDNGADFVPETDRDNSGTNTTGKSSHTCTPTSNDRNNVIDATAIFGGVKKNILSKNFKGGDVTTFMGGAEINLTQADFDGRIIIDCFNMFGGTKLIVPADWEVQSGVVTIFGGIEDKRPPSTTVNPNKLVYIDGTCIFGGVEIKSF
jgi:hypothetical protein